MTILMMLLRFFTDFCAASTLIRVTYGILFLRTKFKIEITKVKKWMVDFFPCLWLTSHYIRLNEWHTWNHVLLYREIMRSDWFKYLSIYGNTHPNAHAFLHCETFRRLTVIQMLVIDSYWFQSRNNNVLYAYTYSYTVTNQWCLICFRMVRIHLAGLLAN